MKDIKKPVPLAELLKGPGSRLSQLATEAGRAEALRLRVVRQLPAEVVHHCLGADIRNGELTIILDSAVWATSVRYLHQRLLKAVQNDTGLTCERLNVRVLPGPAPGLPARPAPRSLSSETRSLLESTARALSDSSLAAALRRLARNKGS